MALTRREFLALPFAAVAAVRSEDDAGPAVDEADAEPTADD